MSDENTNTETIPDALGMLAKLARERGLARIADLGDLPPFGTPEWDEWLKQHPPLMRALDGRWCCICGEGHGLTVPVKPGVTGEMLFAHETCLEAPAS